MSNAPLTNGPTMGLEEAATFLRLGHQAMKELVLSGAVPALSLNLKHTVLLRDDLIAYVRKEGRKQADKRKEIERRKLLVAPRSRGDKVALPDLSKYELTTAVRRA